MSLHTCAGGCSRLNAARPPNECSRRPSAPPPHLCAPSPWRAPSPHLLCASDWKPGEAALRQIHPRPSAPTLLGSWAVGAARCAAASQCTLPERLHCCSGPSALAAPLLLHTAHGSHGEYRFLILILSYAINKNSIRFGQWAPDFG